MKKSVSEEVMLWPPARRVEAGTDIELERYPNEIYRIDRYSSPFLTLGRTGHGLTFSDDLVRARIPTPNGKTILWLNAQLYLSGNTARFDPLQAN